MELEGATALAAVSGYISHRLFSIFVAHRRTSQGAPVDCGAGVNKLAGVDFDKDVACASDTLVATSEREPAEEPEPQPQIEAQVDVHAPPQASLEQRVTRRRRASPESDRGPTRLLILLAVFCPLFVCAALLAASRVLLARLSARGQDTTPPSHALGSLHGVARRDAADTQVLKVRLTRQSTNMYDVDDFVRSAYSGTLMVGSPPQPFTVVFDTGSGHLVLPSSYCASESCRVHSRYRRTASTTGRDINSDGARVSPNKARDQISVSFGTGEVTGVFVEDIVCVDTDGDGHESSEHASVKERQVQAGRLPSGCVSLRMIAATDMSEDPFLSFQFDGILGLGLGALSQAPEFNFMNVIGQSLDGRGEGTPQTFAVFLAQTAAEDSEIALGGWARDRVSEDLAWTSVPDPELGHWLLQIKALYVNGKRLQFCTGGCKAAVDTGTSLFAVPTAVFPELYEHLRHPAPLPGGCHGSGPQLSIEFDSFSISLGPRDYARPEFVKDPVYRPQLIDDKTAAAADAASHRTRRDVRCVPMLMTLDLPEPLGPKLFVMGEPVLRKYYTVYDGRLKRVGMGRAKHARMTRRDDLLMASGLRQSGTNPRRRRVPHMFDVFRFHRDFR